MTEIMCRLQAYLRARAGQEVSTAEIARAFGVSCDNVRFMVDGLTHEDPRLAEADTGRLYYLRDDEVTRLDLSMFCAHAATQLPGRVRRVLAA